MKYLTPCAMLCPPNRASSGALSTDFSASSIARPTTTLIICAHHRACVGKWTYFVSMKNVSISPIAQNRIM